MKWKNVQTEMAQMQITIRNEIAKFFQDTIKQFHVQFGSVIRHDNIQGLQRTLKMGHKSHAPTNESVLMAAIRVVSFFKRSNNSWRSRDD